MGRVRSKTRTIEYVRDNNHFDVVHKGKILVASKQHEGYRGVVLSKNCKKERRLIHRLVAIAFIPNPKNKSQVNHKDADKDNNSVGNLEWVSCQENHRHARRANLMPIGERHGNAVLTKKDVLKIRETASNRGYHYRRKELATEYGVAEDTIREVVNRKTWKHI